MSLGSTIQPGTTDSFLVVAAAHETSVVRRPWYLRTGWLLVIWAALSVLWISAVGYDLYQRVSIQAAMSRDVENDLDQGFKTASCVGATCESTAPQAVPQTQNWMGIASTYVRFGSDEMAESVFGPPAALLVIGLAGVFVMRRRRDTAGPAQAQISYD